MRRQNAGNCKCGCGKTFGELVNHFITGGDETCIQAAKENGSVEVIGSVGKKKHEKKRIDNRDSITMYRTGSAKGDTGPTSFLLSGKEKRKGYSEKFLRQYGAAEGSAIAMVPSAYMTTEAWEYLAPSIVRGLRGINRHTKANPDWLMTEIMDGFGAHLASYEAMRIRKEKNIQQVKEEGDSSHVNQAYNKFVAKQDKQVSYESLAMLRKSTYARSYVDQWDLIHVGLYAVRSTSKQCWQNSFDACNLRPSSRIPFLDWCQKIKQHLVVGKNFEPERLLMDKYQLLPAFWRGMSPDEKQKVYDVVEKHKGFSMDCVLELKLSCHIRLQDMQNLRICHECAKEDPTHLQRILPSAAEPFTSTGSNSGTEAQRIVCELAESEIGNVNKGLNVFLVKPPGMKGLALFNHMIKHRELH